MGHLLYWHQLSIEKSISHPDVLPAPGSEGQGREEIQCLSFSSPYLGGQRLTLGQRVSLRNRFTGLQSRDIRVFPGGRTAEKLTTFPMCVPKFPTEHDKPGTRAERSGVTILISHGYQSGHFAHLQVGYRWITSVSISISRFGFDNSTIDGIDTLCLPLCSSSILPA